MWCTLPARAILLAAVAICTSWASEEEACEAALSVEVENGSVEGPSRWLVDADSGARYPQGLYWRNGSTWRACYCRLQPCLRMCCPDGWAIAEDTTECNPPAEGSRGGGDVEGMVLIPEEGLRRVFGNPPCPQGFVEASLDEFNVLDDGTVDAFNVTYNVTQYCLKVMT